MAFFGARATALRLAGHGLIDLPLLVQDLAQVVVSPGVLRVEFDGLLA